MEKIFRKNVPHILEKIFFSLHYGSYVECRKVCKEWNELFSYNRYQREAEKLAEKMKNQETFCKLVRDGNIRNIEEVSHLLSNGVEIDCGGHHDDGLTHAFTPLLLSVTDGHINMVQLLLNGGADPNRANRHGRTPLQVAAWNGRAVVVRILLDRGADPNKADRNGSTPLHDAAWKGHKYVIPLLLNRGADPNKACEDGRTPPEKRIRP